jgi:hypothetical protein
MKVKTDEEYEIYEKALSQIDFPQSMHNWIDANGEHSWHRGVATDKDMIEFAEDNDIDIDEIDSFLSKKLNEIMEELVNIEINEKEQNK